MSSSSTEMTNSPNQAITDVYDEARHTFLLRYPVAVVVGMALAGVVTFALTGFLGFEQPPASTGVSVQPIDRFFTEPWPLFLWFCALIMALEISILRNRLLRVQMVAALMVTFLSMILVGIIYFYGLQIQNLLKQLLNITQVLPQIGDSPYTYALINFGILAIFWVDTVRRWVRVARGQPLRQGVDIGIERHSAQARDIDHPSLDELISGDLIAAAVLALILSLLFHDTVINFISRLLQVNVLVNTCTVSWPFVAHLCVGGGGPHDPPTLAFIDLLQTLIYLPLGLLILALSATLAGLGAAEGVSEPAASARVNTRPLARTGSSATGNVSEEVALTLFDTLRTALNRRARFAANNFALSLRNAVWPALVFVGTLSAAAAARQIRLYLHVLSDKATCHETGYLSCSYVSANLATNGQPYTELATALVLGAVAVLAITFAMALLIFRQRVAENTLRFLGLIGEIVLLTFWIFSLTLSAFNGLLSLLDSGVRVPFPQPGAATIISLGSFLVWGGYLVLSRRARSRGGSASPPSTQTAR